MRSVRRRDHASWIDAVLFDKLLGVSAHVDRRVSLERCKAVSRDGVALELLHVRTRPPTTAELRIDDRFAERGIASSGRLIDLAATAARWGATVGRSPEELLAGAPRGAVGVCPTNFGWQTESFLVRDGSLVTVAGDRSLSGGFLVIGWDGARWGATAVSLLDGQPSRPADAAAIRRLRVGLEVPAIVRDGRPVPRGEWLVHPRLLADLRNAFDFAHGRGVEIPPDVWAELRKALPRSAESARALGDGGDSRETRSREGASRLRALLATARLDHIEVADVPAGIEVVVRGPLAATRLPLVGIGVTADGLLDLTIADGRRADCPGATIEDLAHCMAERGVVVGGLGSAGGDVAVLLSIAAGAALLNVPSTLDPASGRPTTRPVPALLVLG